MHETIRGIRKFSGTLSVPGDKSISHRALILGAAATTGTQRIVGISDAADIRSTAACLRVLGADVRWDASTNPVEVTRGETPRAAVTCDAGNSGTTARLLSGLVAGLGATATLRGDASLSARPMRRVADPLSEMGVSVSLSEHDTLPMTIAPDRALTGIRYTMPMASAQVKSALLIAGLFADGETAVIEPTLTRDHTERMLATMGAAIRVRGNTICVMGREELTATTVHVPGDISSAAFFIVAAACIPNANVRITGVGVNPRRTGLLDVLVEMGARIRVTARAGFGEEPVADLEIESSALRGVTLDDPAIIAAMIDEFPVFAVAATCANGTTVVRGAAELRTKESDRIDGIVRALSAFGARIVAHEDGFTIRGGAPLAGAKVRSGGDHRIAMALSIAALLAQGESTIDGTDAVSISYPGFFADLRRLVPEETIA